MRRSHYLDNGCYPMQPSFPHKCRRWPWWRHQMETFPRYWPFVRGIHRSPVNSLHKGQWRGALMFSLICARINGWVNNGEAGDFRRHRAHYDVIAMALSLSALCGGRQVQVGFNIKLLQTRLKWHALSAKIKAPLWYQDLLSGYRDSLYGECPCTV